MKKKILLVLLMFMFMTNVKALTFNVNVTNIEDKGNNGTIGTITNIDQDEKEISAFFQDIGDEISFSVTVTNSGDRAGTLREIEVEGTNGKIEYTNNLPDGGLAINGNDTNEVVITAKVKDGAVNGKTTSSVKLKYTYDEGSCPDGEILSDDESMCLCPTGMERNEKGVCAKPEKPVECAKDEIYNSEKKICEKKVVPVTPNNPKTLDNIILVTLLFIVSGLGIYAVMFKKLKTFKQKKVVGAIVGVLTLGTSFTVLAGAFGLDNLLSAIVNPITKSKELVITVNEEIELIETWDGSCDLEIANLTPENIFEGGSGTESDPYQIKYAEQLSCLAKSVNNGTTYEGQYIKQIKNIKLNDKANDNVEAGTTTDLHAWTPIGYNYYDSNEDLTIIRNFSGTYDGDNHVISGLYITDDSYGDYKALFGCEIYGTFKNMVLSDVCINTTGYAAGLVGQGYNDLRIDNVKTYGRVVSAAGSAGVVEYYMSSGPKTPGKLDIENTENNISFLNANNTLGGIVAVAIINNSSDEPNLVLKNVTNNGDIRVGSTTGGIMGVAPNPFANALVANAVNNGNFENADGENGYVGGLFGYFQPSTGIVKDSYNTGNFVRHPSNTVGYWGGIIANPGSSSTLTIENCYNSGNITYNSTVNGQMVGLEIDLSGMTESQFNALDIYDNDAIGGIVGNNNAKLTINNSYNTGSITAVGAAIGGIMGGDTGEYSNINNSYNLGEIKGTHDVGGIIGQGGPTITNCYNKGNITQFATSDMVGGIVGDRSRNASTVRNSYNEGNITTVSKVASSYVAGICGQCDYIYNSYNRGDITVKNGLGYANGIIFNTTTGDPIVRNVYNSGKVSVLTKQSGLSSSYTYSYANGIGGVANANFENVYNMGDVVVENNYDVPNLYIYVGGIATTSGKSFNNCVNTGNVTAKLNVQPTNPFTFDLGGIEIFANGSVKNSFNAGVVSIDDSALTTPIATDGLAHSYTIGEIKASYDSGSFGNKFTNEGKFALGQYPSVATLEQSQAVGVYTTESAPDIMSVINGEDAFEILEGETLPTLKVFNN